MSFFSHFFQKRAAELNLLRIEQEQRMRFNPLKNFDPDKLVRAIDAFRVGDIGSLSQIIDELETRDDMMAGVARKTRASVGRCPHQVLVTEGAEGDPRAERHREVLTRFWAGIEVSSAFTRNERGGARLLKKQMMGAASRVYSVHEIVWKPLANGEISARFVHVPNWFFENRTGELRYLQSPGALNGSEMRPGEWLVTVGDGIGIAAAVLAMAKTLSRNDWLLFSERCGQPGLHVQTAAADGSPAWDKLVSAVRNFGREWSLVSDTQTKLNPVSLNVGGTLPYPPLIEMCNKGIAALYRGADLSTISGPTGDSTGASVQGDETDILEQDACEMISETLNAQVDRYVIRYVLGDDVPLAYLSIAPSDRPNVDQDIKIDNHLVSLGVRLSRNDALARYGRTEYDDTDDSDAPLVMQQPGGAPFGGLANETPSRIVATPLQNAPGGKDVASDGPADETPQNANAGPLADLAKSLASDLRPVAERVAALLALPEAEQAAAAAALAGELPGLLPRDPEMAAILEAEIAEAFAGAFGLDNDNPNRAPAGQFAPQGTGDQTGGPRAREPKTRGKSDSLGMLPDPDHPERFGADENRKRGSNALDRAMRQGADVKKAMHTPECGAIDFDWGTPGERAKDHAGGWGISHIAAKHPGDVKALPEIIARGETYQLPRSKGADGPSAPIRYAVVLDNRVAFLDKRGKTSSFAVTAFTKDPDAIASIKQNPLAKPRGS